MKKALVAAVLALLVVASASYALIDANDTGAWPKSWPAEMEPLRKQARTVVEPNAESRHYAIRFTSGKQLEAVWSSLLEVKIKGAPIIVSRIPNFFMGDRKGGIVIHCPPEGQGKEARNAESIEVVDDGVEVVFERLKVPKGTPVIDERKPPGIQE